jgi:hypothetical protein
MGKVKQKIEKVTGEVVTEVEETGSPSMEDFIAADVEFGEETADVEETALSTQKAQSTSSLIERDFASEIMARKTGFCSFDVTTKEGKMVLYKCMNDPDKKTSEEVNTVIKLKDIFVETVTLAKNDQDGNPVLDANGEVIRENVPRIVLVDVEGVTYQSCSFGVFNSLRAIMTAFGDPKTWEQPLEVVAKNVTKGQNKILTLKIK